MLLFVVGSTRGITPSDNVGVLWVWFAVSIKIQEDIEYNLRWANATADGWLWRINVEVSGTNVPDLSLAQPL
ncbi:MAG: hypothetical protein AB1898_08545 [Acidobacteriota bacterium]